MKKGIILYVFVISLLCSCGGVKSKYEQEARVRAVVAAQALIETDHKDMIKMEEMILDAKAVQSEYLLMGDTVAAQSFDIAFREYLVVNDSLLAKEIFK